MSLRHALDRGIDWWEWVCAALGREPADALRPAVPPVLRLALGLWAGAAASYTVAFYLPGNICASAAMLSGAGALVLTGVGFREKAVRSSGWRGRLLGFSYLLIGLLLGLSCGFAGGAKLHHQMAEVGQSQSGVRTLTALEDAGQSMFGSSCLMLAKEEDGRTVKVRAYFDGDVQISYGSILQSHCTLESPSEGSAQRCWQDGVAGTIDVKSFERVPRSDALGVLCEVRARAVEAFYARSGDASALLAALICNERTRLDQGELYDSYRISGLAHIVAVSGSHLVVVGSFVALATRALRLPRAAALLLQMLIMVGYLVFSACPVSAIRAVAVSALGMLSYFSRRRSAPLNALGVCTIALVSTAPETALSASFILSAGSSLGIVLLGGLFSSWLDSLAALPSFVRDVLAMTTAASVATMPYSASLFAQVPLVSPLANILAAPLFSVVCLAGLLAALAGAMASVWAVLMPPAAFVMDATMLAAGAMNGVVSLCAALPYAAVPASVPQGFALAASALCLYALWRFWPRLDARVLAAAFAAAVFAAAMVVCLPSYRGTRIVMLDVGQGDAFLVQSDSSCVLIDTGTNDTLLLQALARHRVHRIDAVVITHGDDDHCGSLSALKGVVQVEAVVVASDTLTCGCNACETLLADAEKVVGEGGVKAVEAGDALQVGCVRLEVLWPSGFAEGGGNADSVCLMACFDPNNDGVIDWRALFTGDAEAEELAKMLRGGLLRESPSASAYSASSQSDLFQGVDILKVGHHGSKASLDEEVLETLNSEIALVSVGEGNRYGHPASEVLALLENAGCRVYRTDLQGDVSCEITCEQVRVVTQR